MKYLALLAGCFIFLTAFSIPSMAQQTAARDPEVAQPLKVTALTLNAGKTRRALKNAEWLSQPLVQVENTSHNIIEYLVIEVNLPGTTNSPLMLAYGQTPGYKALPNVAALEPGKKINLSVSGNACEAVHSRLLASGTQLPPGTRVSTRINAVVFTNRTAWFDGLLHVPDPNDPMRWMVAENLDRAGLPGPSPLFNFMPAAFRPKVTPAPCWKRIGTQWVNCCGVQIASAILANVWGGILEPFPMSTQCEDGSFCNWTKAVECSNDPGGEVPPSSMY